jgi:hypothetical protein
MVTDEVVSAVSSPDGHRLVTIGSAVLLWDATTGHLLGRLIKDPEGRLTHVEFSDDSRFLVTGSDRGPVRLYGARTGEPMGVPFQHGGGVYHVAIAADGGRLVTCGTDGTAQVWDTATSSPIGPRLGHADAVNWAALGPDGRQVATALTDGTVRVWDVTTGHPVTRSLSHDFQYFVVHVAFDPSGRLLITQGYSLADHSLGLWIWDTATQEVVSPIIRVPVFWNLGDVVARWSPDSQFVLRGAKYDLRPDQRPVEDLVKIAQLYAGKRLDEQGNAAPLATAELEGLWNELRAKYPDEFIVRPEALMAWRVERVQALTRNSDVTTPAIRLHRKWLAEQMATMDWHEDPATCSLGWTSSSLFRLQAEAQFGRTQEAIATVDALVKRGSLSGYELDEGGRIYALAAGAVKGDAALADRYAARAVALLRHAADAGYMDGQHALKDPDLDALRGRKAFIDLLWDLAEGR